MQSSAVGRAVTHQREATGTPNTAGVVGGRAMLALLRNPEWLASVGIIILAGVLHAAGLALAPISIVQPVGVLAIPFAILIAARKRRQSPPTAVTMAVTVTMLAVLAFVLAAASDGNNADRIDAVHVAWASLGIGVLAAVLALVGSVGPRWLRCVAWSSAGAVVYGLASAMLRTDTMLIKQGGLLSGHVLGYTAAVIAAFVVGGWLVQHAHANGPPAVVIGSLTVVDPIVAVLFGIAFLGEGASLSPLHTAVMAASAVAATIGVVLLARHHPEGHEESDPPPAPDAPHLAAHEHRAHQAASDQHHHSTSRHHPGAPQQEAPQPPDPREEHTP